MPCRAMSIIPLLIAAPINTPIAAIVMIVRKEAALAPIAEFKKLTASLLTPTERSKIANKKRKITIPKKTISINRIFRICIANERNRCYKTISTL